MAKDKKNSSSKNPDKKSKKGKKSPPSKPAAEGLTGLLAQVQTVSDLRRQVGELSTGQVVVGGVALLAAGLTYWAKQRSSTAPASVAPPIAPTAAPAAAPAPTVEEKPEPVEAEVVAVTKKKAKPRKKAE